MDGATFTAATRDLASTEAAVGGAHAPAAKAGPTLDGGRIRDLVLVRIATAGKALARADLTADLWPIVSHLTNHADWQTTLDRDLGALSDAGLCDVKPVAVSITPAGAKRAALVLGANLVPRNWSEAKAKSLMAKALGLEGLPPRRQKALAKPDGLRAAIVQRAFDLVSRSTPSPAALRASLASIALRRAFADGVPEEQARSGLSAKAGRALAGRLANPPRTFPTDARLVSALAIEHAGAAKADLSSLQLALLRRYVTRGTAVPPPKAATVVRAAKPSEPAAPVASVARPVATVPAAPPPAAAVRPDFNSFVAAVRAAAGPVAEGWPGNRKAFVSRVWTAVRAAHPDWAVSGIEFKAMLAEAHRLGRIVLANADLKDSAAIADLNASAIAYRNAVFHYVRVDD